MTRGPKAEEQRRREFERLNDTLAMMGGRSFLTATWSYGEELHLHVAGEGGNPSRSDPESWVITTRASRWVLLSGSAVVSRDVDEKDPELRRFRALQDATIVSAKARFEDYALCMSFSNDYRFLILTKKRRSMKKPDLELWQVYAPNLDIVIDVQPNGRIDFVPGAVTRE